MQKEYLGEFEELVLTHGRHFARKTPNGNAIVMK